MRVPGLKRVKRSAMWVSSRVVGRGLILGYHRVTDDPRASHGLSVSPRYFAEQLEAVRRWARPLSLMEVTGRLVDGTLPGRAVAVTFDDGYSDNLYNARPLLERYDIPATVFVTTGFMGSECWWDEVDRLLARSDALPARLALTVEGVAHRWDLRDDVGRPSRSNPDGGKKQGIATQIYQLLLPLPAEAREQAMSQLRSQVAVGGVDAPSSRVMTGEELSRLVEGGLVEIGAHSVTHPVLTALSPLGQESEIRQGKEQLEDLLGKPVGGFSYPNGAFSDHTRSLVKDAGFSCACASYNNVVSLGSDRFSLPRFWVPDWDGERFSRWLRLWLPG